MVGPDSGDAAGRGCRFARRSITAAAAFTAHVLLAKLKKADVCLGCMSDNEECLWNVFHIVLLMVVCVGCS